MLAPLILTFYTLFMGAWTACFVGCAAYRIPRGVSLSGRSYCEECHKTLSLDIAPVIGYMLLRGKCRYCHTRIPVIYPSIEAGLALLYYAYFALWGIGLKWPVAAICSALLLYFGMVFFYFKLPLSSKKYIFILLLILALCGLFVTP